MCWRCRGQPRTPGSACACGCRHRHTACPLQPKQRLLPLLASLQVLWKTYGRDLMIAGLFKLMWSVFVILGGERPLHLHHPALRAVRRRCQAAGACQQAAASDTARLHLHHLSSTCAAPLTPCPRPQPTSSPAPSCCASAHWRARTPPPTTPSGRAGSSPASSSSTHGCWVGGRAPAAGFLSSLTLAGRMSASSRQPCRAAAAALSAWPCSARPAAHHPARPLPCSAARPALPCTAALQALRCSAWPLAA